MRYLRWYKNELERDNFQIVEGCIDRFPREHPCNSECITEGVKIKASNWKILTIFLLTDTLSVFHQFPYLTSFFFWTKHCSWNSPPSSLQKETWVLCILNFRLGGGGLQRKFLTGEQGALNFFQRKFFEGTFKAGEIFSKEILYCSWLARHIPKRSLINFSR